MDEWLSPINRLSLKGAFGWSHELQVSQSSQSVLCWCSERINDSNSNETPLVSVNYALNVSFASEDVTRFKMSGT